MYVFAAKIQNDSFIRVNVLLEYLDQKWSVAKTRPTGPVPPIALHKNRQKTP